MTKIQLKRSNVLDSGKAKEPTSAQMEYGELAVNYNAIDPAIFIKNSNNQIVKIAGNNLVEIPTVGDGSLTIKTFNEGASATGSFTANQSSDSEITLPQIRYEDISDVPVTETGLFTPTFANRGSITYGGQFGYYSHIGDRTFINCRIDWSNGAGNSNDVAIEVPVTQRIGTVAATGSCTFLKLPGGNPLENFSVIPTIFPESNLIKFILGGFRPGALGLNVLKYDDMTQGDIRLSIIINE